jgi:zinc protease
VARDIADLVRFDLPDDYWDHYATLVSELDAAAVDAMAKRLLTPGRLTWVVVGDLRVIEPSVRALGFGEVQIVDTDGNPAGNP